MEYTTWIIIVIYFMYGIFYRERDVENNKTNLNAKFGLLYLINTHCLVINKGLEKLSFGSIMFAGTIWIIA